MLIVWVPIPPIDKVKLIESRGKAKSDMTHVEFNQKVLNLYIDPVTK
jgi:hypothetical protein